MSTIDHLSKIHPKAIEAVKNALLNLDAGTLVEWLHTGNKNLRKHFTQQTGVKLPRSEKGTRLAIIEYIKEQKKE